MFGFTYGAFGGFSIALYRIVLIKKSESLMSTDLSGPGTWKLAGTILVLCIAGTSLLSMHYILEPSHRTFIV